MRMKLNSIINNSMVFLIFRLLVGFMFVYAGLEKISNPADFAVAVDNYRILPASLINFFAIVLPWIELFAGGCLILGLFMNGSSLILLGLLVIFTVAISINLIRGVDISCGCKTPWELSDKISIRKLLEEFILMLMMIQVYFHSSKFLCLGNLFQKNKA